MKKTGGRFALSIKQRLFLLCLATLSIPYVGMQYLQEMERFLQQSLEQSLLDAARAIAGPLHQHPELFHLAWDNNQQSLFMHDIDHAIQVDGYTDDWKLYLDWANSFDQAGRQGVPKFSSLIARHDRQVYVLLQVNDDQLLYNTPDQNEQVNGDYVSLIFSDPSGHLQHYYFAPEAPGAMFPFRLQQYRPDDPFFEFSEPTVTRSYLTNVQSDWQQTDTGYVLEIRLSELQLGNRIGFIVNDVFSEAGELKSLTTGSAGVMTATTPNLLLRPSESIRAIIDQPHIQAGRRVWVLDQKSQVLAVVGDLDTQTENTSTNILYEWLLPDINQRIDDDLAGRSRLQGEEIQSALDGGQGLRWRQANRQAVIVSAAVPVWSGDVVQGAVMVEETSHRIQLIQRAAMTNLLNKTLFVFILVAALLLWFAIQISWRLRKLSHAVDAVIDEHGRVTGTMTPLSGNDEITRLSRHYADIVQRLQQYHQYLEGLSGKLSHELRTPMAVVQTSLENLSDDLAVDQQQVYVQRARDGIQRLNLLVTRLSEAARIEQAIQSAEREPTDLCALLQHTIDAYAGVWPNQEFALRVPDQPVNYAVAPELFSQMLDKLIGNAVDFSAPGREIRIQLNEYKQTLELSIINYGSRLPDEISGQLFESMISKREQKTDQPHLGLGLYIARLIAEFHSGTISAINLQEETGVCFLIRFDGKKQ